MSKMIQIRNVSDEVHRVFKVRAAKAGMSLSDYLKRELELIAQRPTLNEMLERLSKQPPLELDVDIAEMIREDRENHY
jgi:plasmid stability protein